MSLGGFRLLWQPLRPFIAGTKVTNYMIMKNADEELVRRRSFSTNMIQVYPSMSPPQTPDDLSAQVNLVAASPGLTKCSLTTARTPTSPEVSYDGVTFTADVAQLFAVAPTSPPDSVDDNTEVSLFDDVSIEKTGDGAHVASSASPGVCPDVFLETELTEADIEAMQSTPGLASALTSALQTGSMMPLIKEELKCTIQTKRMRNGKGELSLEKERKLTTKLSADEKERRARRRERNKIAAQKCRDKKMKCAQELQEEIETLEKANSVLRMDDERLHMEIEQLRDMMVRHDKSTQCGQPVLRTAEDAGLLTPQPKRQKTTKRAPRTGSSK